MNPVEMPEGPIDFPARIAGNFVGPGEERAALDGGTIGAKIAGQAARDGIKSLEKSADSLEKQISVHEAKIADAINKGGYISSMEREVKAFKKELDAIRSFLKQLSEQAPQKGTN